MRFNELKTHFRGFLAPRFVATLSHTPKLHYRSRVYLRLEGRRAPKINRQCVRGRQPIKCAQPIYQKMLSGLCAENKHINHALYLRSSNLCHEIFCLCTFTPADDTRSIHISLSIRCSQTSAWVCRGKNDSLSSRAINPRRLAFITTRANKLLRSLKHSLKSCYIDLKNVTALSPGRHNQIFTRRHFKQLDFF